MTVALLIATLALAGAPFQPADSAPDTTDAARAHTPPIRTGLLLDLDAGEDVTVEDGDRVVRWVNQVPDGGARIFRNREKGRENPGSGRPTLRRDVEAIAGHDALVFRRQELVNMEEDVFDALTRGSGYTWFAVLAPFTQSGGLADVNSFFGNLRNGGNFEGIWGNLDDENRVWIGSRNGITFGRFDANNPKLLGPKLYRGRYYVVAGRMAAGRDTVPIEVFVDDAEPDGTVPFPVNPKADASKMAIGQERDATGHPGRESFEGALARFLIYERPLAQTEMEEVFEYLRYRYELPGLHQVTGSALAGDRPGPPSSETIRLNQVGFYPGAPKRAAIVGAEASAFQVIDLADGDTAYTGTLGPSRTSEHSGETVRTAEFTELNGSGEYVLALSGRALSHPFRVAPNVHGEAAEAALKGFYFQRASTALHRKWAAQWGRAGGHPDDSVRVHPSAASEERPAGTTIAAPGGWYDAGDYNKYVVNSGISTATLLSLYEEFPAHLDTLETDIPESTNELPDVLDEALWNVRWMLAMQDPNDGGVYHKLTTPNFSGAVMPSAGGGTRYVVQKSTAATLDFAAVMAQASRIFERFPAALPGLADSCRTAAERAWNWARRNPHRIYDQDRLNEQFDPDVETGAYGDTELDDERAWAAAELYVSTGRDSFFQAVSLPEGTTVPLPSWSQVRTLGYYSLLRHRSTLDPTASEKLDRIRARLVRYADALTGHADSSAYRVPMGRRPENFVWGSNSVAANQGVALIQAYRLTSDPAYLDGALANLDYLLGRNATGYSFLTGHGARTPRHPHHRPSRADAIPAPVPGLLVGGPNPGQQDGCTYPSDRPARSYVDDWCSYASNEIAINWNAPMAYLTVAVEVLQRDRD